MRIGFTSFDMPWSLLGGTEVHVDRLAASLATRFGDDVTVFTRRAPDRPTPYRVEHVAASRLLEATVRPYYRFRMASRRGFARRASRRIALGNPRFNVAHFHGYFGSPWHLRGQRAVATIHLPFEFNYRAGRRQIIAAGGSRLRLAAQGRLHGRQRRWAARYYEALDAVACVSADIQRLLQEEYGVEATVVPHGADPMPTPLTRAQAKRRLDWGRFDRVLLFLGRLEPVKRPLSLLSLARGGTAVAFVGTGSLAPQIQRAALKNANVLWLGAAREDQKWLPFRAADVFVLPSEAEGQPVAIIEALAYGTPVFTTRREWVPAEYQRYCAFGDVEAGVDRALRIRVPPQLVPTWDAVAGIVRRLYETS